LQQAIQITLWILSGIIILFSLIPLIRKDHWTFRVFEFPRTQKWVINVAIAITYVLVIGISSTTDWLLISLLTANFFYLTYQIYPYLPISPKQIQSAKKGQDADIKLLISNVYQYNRKFDKLNTLVHEIDADLVIMVETDKWWKEKSLEGFGEKYEYQILEDQEDTYGMLIFSKLPLINTKVRHLIKKEIPSVVTDIILRDERKIKLFAIHPEPPVPSENPYSTDRDAEILLVGKEAANEEMPVIVAGDLNDVAWSYTSTLFQRISGLLDPRRGRGFYSSFHAKHPLFRWPLDHIFCSGHFRVHSIRRLRGIGSDHFPITIDLHLDAVDDDSEELEVDNEDKKVADEKIKAAV
jgi:endonuclease/exonuclease/phosphatase (EEP) superfamily protein YafD